MAVAPLLELKKRHSVVLQNTRNFRSRLRRPQNTSFNLVAKRRKKLLFAFVPPKNGGLLKVWVVLRPS